jgi:hypothetical protein
MNRLKKEQVKSLIDRFLDGHIEVKVIDQFIKGINERDVRKKLYSNVNWLDYYESRVYILHTSTICEYKIEPMDLDYLNDDGLKYRPFRYSKIIFDTIRVKPKLVISGAPYKVGATFHEFEGTYSAPYNTIEMIKLDALVFEFIELGDIEIRLEKDQRLKIRDKLLKDFGKVHLHYKSFDTVFLQ